jgi:hypothetical protein
VPGPVPNRSADLNRPRERKGGDNAAVTKGVSLPATPYKPDPEWHAIARMLWDSLAVSGQAEFYQQSDWAFAYSVCEDLSMYKKPTVSKDGEDYYKRSGQMLQTIYAAFERLLVTEGDRRRVRIELEEQGEETTPASVTAIADYRADLGVA